MSSIREVGPSHTLTLPLDDCCGCLVSRAMVPMQHFRTDFFHDSVKPHNVKLPHFHHPSSHVVAELVQSFADPVARTGQAVGFQVPLEVLLELGVASRFSDQLLQIGSCCFEAC